MSDERNINNNEDKERSNFLRGLPLGGLPLHAAQVDDSPTDSDEPSLVYRAFTIGGSSTALLRTAASVTSKDHGGIGSSPLLSVTEHKPQLPPPAPICIRYVDIERPLSFTHVLLPGQDSEILKAVDDFLTKGGISSENKHPQSNIYRCHTIIDCSIIRFDIRLVPGQDMQGVNVEFKRTFGPAEAFAKLYKQFKASVGIESSTRSSSPVSPASLGVEGEEDESIDPAEIARAVAAMALWVERDPIEALQCVGQFYIARNYHVTDSAEILAAICRVIEKCQNLTDDISTLTSCVAISCVRQFMASARQVQSSNDVLTEHVHSIAPGIAKAAMGKDLTARREAVGLLMELNPRFGSDIQDRVSHMPGFSAVCTPTVA